MSDLPYVYCCSQHRDEKLSTMNLIGCLSNAYQQVLTLLKSQTEVMKQCRISQSKDSKTTQLQEEEMQNIDTVSQRVKDLIEQVTQPMEKLFSQHRSTKVDSPINLCDEEIRSHRKIDKVNILKSPVLQKCKPKQRTPVSPFILSDSSPDGSTLSITKKNPISNTPEQNLRKRSLLSPFNESVHDSSMFQNSDADIVLSTPVTKSCKTIGLSKLYNVETTLLHTGKKLKQTTLTLMSAKNCENPISKSSFPAQPVEICNSSHALPLEESKVVDDKYLDKTLGEEIIEESPNCLQNIKVKKRFKFKKRNPGTKMKRYPNEKETCIKQSGESTITENFSLSELQESKFDEFSPPKFSSTQKDSFVLTNKYTSNKGLCNVNDENAIPSMNANYPHGPVTLKNSSHKNVAAEVMGSKGKGVDNNGMQNLKRKLPISESLSASCQDETYFAAVENGNKNDAPIPQQNLYSDDNTDITYIELDSPPVKRTLLTNFNRFEPKEKNKLNISPKSKQTTATGIECWECQKYYKSLGLTEEEIKARKNTCSRHRNNYGERPDTPDGFWDFVFPDTHPSTLQDD